MNRTCNDGSFWGDRVAVRKIIVIDEEKCDGCGICADACHEGAIRIIDGKAKLVSESYCDGLGDCIDPCPQDAITPVQLMLVPPNAPFIKDSDLLVCADCVPFAVPDFHNSCLAGRSVVVGCPKLDDSQYYYEKLKAMFTEARPRSITVVRMEVPCCGGLGKLVTAARNETAPDVPVEVQTIGIRGEIQRTERFGPEQIGWKGRRHGWHAAGQICFTSTGVRE